jgi:chemotaxis signal transduction protein
VSQPLPTSGEPPRPYFQFRLGDTLLLCPAEAVEGITHFEAPVPLPRVPPHVLGLITSDQRALVLVDLAPFLRLPAGSDAERTRTLVVNSGAYRVGLAVEAALGVVTLDATGFQECTGLFGESLAEYAIAASSSEAGGGAVLDLERLLEAARV